MERGVGSDPGRCDAAIFNVISFNANRNSEGTHYSGSGLPKYSSIPNNSFDLSFVRSFRAAIGIARDSFDDS